MIDVMNRALQERLKLSGTNERYSGFVDLHSSVRFHPVPSYTERFLIHQQYRIHTDEEQSHQILT